MIAEINKRIFERHMEMIKSYPIVEKTKVFDEAFELPIVEKKQVSILNN